jgi:hypothetical protein
LLEQGHQVIRYQWDEPITQPITGNKLPNDLAIFLEVVPREFLKIAPVRWAFLNPEWMTPDRVQTVSLGIDKIFAKTREAERIFSPLFPGRVKYTGFLTRDQCLPEIERKPWFLHIGGNSSLRGTQTVVDAWKWTYEGKRLDRHLIVVSTALQDRPEIPMVTYHEKLSEEELKSYQNECMFHIYPSGTEGWGHAIHEAQSCGAVLLVTGQPPMNEIPHIYPIFGKKASKYNLADVYEVSAIDIFDRVTTCSEIYRVRPEQEWKEEQRQIRAHFLTANEEFKKIFNDELNFGVKIASVKKFVRPVRTGDKKIVAFLGNFASPESTENMIKWGLEELGHQVIEIQENEATVDWLEETFNYADVFFWVKTPGFLKVNDGRMQRILDSALIPTASIHLDKFWGIPEREPAIGKTPFWKTDFVFTADGSQPEKFISRGVNHFWMKPAVSQVYCHPGVPRAHFLCDVGFVGAREYHREYPFRADLVEFLEKTYGDRFKLIQGVRGHDLNDFYASCKVAVGDCIFAGTPNYWSDRVPETCGRWGFLLHPDVAGLDIPVAKYTAQNLENLRAQIEYWLSHDDHRLRVRTVATFETLQNNTWATRLRWILETMGKK